jgi:hypothetical protein
MRYFIGLMVAIILLIIIIVMLITSGGKSAKAPTVRPLESYSTTDAAVRMVIDGPINAPQLHQQVQVTISASDASYVQIQGYDGAVVNSQTYYNSPNSFYAFLRALNQAYFTEGNNDPALSNNTGLCPLGDRYNFELIQNDQTIENYWATSCGGLATYNGNLDLTMQLFEAQIPNYNTLTSNLNF